MRILSQFHHLDVRAVSPNDQDCERLIGALTVAACIRDEHVVQKGIKSDFFAGWVESSRPVVVFAVQFDLRGIEAPTVVSSILLCQPQDLQ